MAQTEQPPVEQMQRFLTGDPVVDRALGLLPPMTNKVTVIPKAKLHPAVQKTLSPTVAAFHTPGSTNLTVLSDSQMYQDASNEQNKLAQYLLASAILHEKQHDQYPSTEIEPYTAQLKFLENYQPDSTPEAFKAYHQSVDQIKQILSRLQAGKRP